MCTLKYFYTFILSFIQPHKEMLVDPKLLVKVSYEKTTGTILKSIRSSQMLLRTNKEENQFGQYLRVSGVGLRLQLLAVTTPLDIFMGLKVWRFERIEIQAWGLRS